MPQNGGDYKDEIRCDAVLQSHLTLSSSLARKGACTTCNRKTMSPEN